MIASKTDTRAEHPAPKDWLRANARSVRGLLLAGIGLATAGVLLIVQAGLLAWVVYQILFRAEFWPPFRQTDRSDADFDADPITALYQENNALSN